MPTIVQGLNQIHIFIGESREALTPEQALEFASNLITETREVILAHTKDVIAEVDRALAEQPWGDK